MAVAIACGGHRDDVIYIGLDRVIVVANVLIFASKMHNFNKRPPFRCCHSHINYDSVRYANSKLISKINFDNLESSDFTTILRLRLRC